MADTYLHVVSETSLHSKTNLVFLVVEEALSVVVEMGVAEVVSAFVVVALVELGTAKSHHWHRSKERMSLEPLVLVVVEDARAVVVLAMVEVEVLRGVVVVRRVVVVDVGGVVVVVDGVVVAAAAVVVVRGVVVVVAGGAVVVGSMR